MGNTTSVPVKHDETAYINSLNVGEKEVADLFNEVRNSKSEAKLIDLVKSGKLSPTT